MPATDILAGDAFAAALTRDAARRADFAIVVLEDRHFLPGDGQGWSRPGPATMALLRALAGSGPRLVALIAASRPVDMGDAGEHFCAILQCWAPCEGFAEALGDILAGRQGPQGRMPVTVGQFPFGHGLGFAETSLRGLDLRVGEDGVIASVTLHNPSNFPMRETLQFYVRDNAGALSLRAFRDVMLVAGEEKTATALLRLDAFTTADPATAAELPSGKFEVLAGKDSRRTLGGTVTITPDIARAMARRERIEFRLAG